MALRTPPGRAGRQWLAARIATAEHALDLLEQKRAVLLAAERDAALRAAEAGAAWHVQAAEAERWLRRTVLLDGERPLRLARAHADGPAAVDVTWQAVMGTTVPAAVSVTLPPPPPAAVLPGGSALTAALAAHRAALEAAARAAAARAAHARLAAELRATARRVRAIESRWLPLHRQALAGLEQALDESERAEGASVRWAARRRRGAVAGD
jgi:V/A-type H+-transporting ATPase subunit D